MEVEDLKKVSNSLAVLLSEKQKQEKVSDYMLFMCFNCSNQVTFYVTVQFLISFVLRLLQQNKGKKKKKGVVPGGGLKAQLRDDLDYAEFDGGYAQDYEDFM